MYQCAYKGLPYSLYVGDNPHQEELYTFVKTLHYARIEITN